MHSSNSIDSVEFVDSTFSNFEIKNYLKKYSTNSTDTVDTTCIEFN